MFLSRPQIIYCLLGINQLAFQNMIDSCTANSIINNLSLELLKECEEYSNSLIDSLSSVETNEKVTDNDSNTSDSLKRDPKSGWPINDL